MDESKVMEDGSQGSMHVDTNGMTGKFMDETMSDGKLVEQMMEAKCTEAKFIAQTRDGGIVRRKNATVTHSNNEVDTDPCNGHSYETRSHGNGPMNGHSVGSSGHTDGINGQSLELVGHTIGSNSNGQTVGSNGQTVGSVVQADRSVGQMDGSSEDSLESIGHTVGSNGQTVGSNGHSVGSNGHPMNGRHTMDGKQARSNGKMCNGNGGRKRIRKPWGWTDWLGFCVGLGVGAACGLVYAYYLYVLNENRLWFSHIKEVEREISFRTESGLYYSYYKQFINAPSISQGFYELRHDNNTENWRTINVLQRFNIYQEVFLAFLYRTIPFIHSRFLPIFFYIKSVFALHGVYFTTIFAMGWLLTNSWLTGLLACTFFIANREDTTRVDFTIPLRESFALPFLYLQMSFITYYFRPSFPASRQWWCTGMAAVCTFLFVLTWQFAQFILLLQAMALYCGTIAGIMPLHKVTRIFHFQLASIVIVCVLQFFNKMLLGSLVFSFIVTALIDFHLQNGRPVVKGISGHIGRLITRLAFTTVGMFIMNIAIKVVIGLDADQHIFKFLTAKFGLSHARDFDVLLYKCHSAFSFLPLHVLRRLTLSMVFPIYTAVVFGLLSILIVAVFQNWSEMTELSARKKDDDVANKSSTSSSATSSTSSSATSSTSSSATSSTSSSATSSPPPSPAPLSSPRGMLRRPDLAFHTLQTIPFALMAFMVLRMKFVWTPQMCVLAAFGIGNTTLWRWLLGKLGFKSDTLVQCVRHSVAVVIIAVTLVLCYPKMSSELSILREFYDPDTVELMNWIRQDTPKTAVFSGSMQLLAGVKLCTGRRLTNHPHYEDKQLRDTTMQLYQYYARRNGQEVYDIHRAIGTDYIILEDSICYGKSSEVGCRLPDILDIMNGHLYSEANQALEPDLKHPKIRRFCDAIKKGGQDLTRLFSLVFQNRTFRVYELLDQGRGNT